MLWSIPWISYCMFDDSMGGIVSLWYITDGITDGFTNGAQVFRTHLLNIKTENPFNPRKLQTECEYCLYYYSLKHDKTIEIVLLRAH